MSRLNKSISSKLFKKVILVVNKVDDTFKNYDSHVFYNLGFGDFFCISAINGKGCKELTYEIMKYIELQKNNYEKI